MGPAKRRGTLVKGRRRSNLGGAGLGCAVALGALTSSRTRRRARGARPRPTVRSRENRPFDKGRACRGPPAPCFGQPPPRRPAGPTRATRPVSLRGGEPGSQPKPNAGLTVEGVQSAFADERRRQGPRPRSGPPNAAAWRSTLSKEIIRGAIGIALLKALAVSPDPMPLSRKGPARCRCLGRRRPDTVARRQPLGSDRRRVRSQCRQAPDT
jgi:hypothetical protein